MKFFRRLTLLSAALFAGLSAFAQSLPGSTVDWKTEVMTDESGKAVIVFTGTPTVALDQIHGTLEWISCSGNNCHSPEEIEFNLNPATAGGTPPEGRNTRGSIAGGPSRRDGGVSPQDELPKGEHLPSDRCK